MATGGSGAAEDDVNEEATLSPLEPEREPATGGSGATEGSETASAFEWPTHGGYLGCLMGMFIGCVLAGFLSSTIISFVHFVRGTAQPLFIIAAVVLMVVVIGVFGRIGWGAGKRFYRDYQQPAEPTTGASPQ